ncbi:hypothetical protein EVA_14142, partial [gut metagenome]
LAGIGNLIHCTAILFVISSLGSRLCSVYAIKTCKGQE